MTYLPMLCHHFLIRVILLKSVASELGLPEGIPVSYRAGDQPNNALSLNVLEPGEVAATAGTSGVIYGVTDKKKHEPQVEGKYIPSCQSFRFFTTLGCIAVHQRNRDPQFMAQA
ncbi:MAG: hypothetical protein MZU84_00155 [Sphingobacterium sp.]|nr:hypothetical protein [Sphingobacterium sp.]